MREGKRDKTTFPPTHPAADFIFYSMQPYRRQVDEEWQTARSSLLFDLLTPLASFRMFDFFTNTQEQALESKFAD